MTPTERAEKIVRWEWTANYCNGDDCITDAEWRKLESIIAAALTAARAEGWAEAIKRLDGIQKEAHWLGFRECQTKAHKVAVKRVDDTPRMEYEAGWSRASELIANEIKALAPEEK